MKSSFALLGRRLAFAAVLISTFLPGVRADDNNPGVICNGPVLKETASLPSAIDFDATPAPPVIDFASAYDVPAATGSYAKLSTTFGDIYIEFVNGAVVTSGETTTAADATINRIKSYLATGSGADSSADSFDGVFFHRSVTTNDFSIIQSGGYKLQAGLNLLNIASKAKLKNQFLAANTRGTLAMARETEPDSAVNQWFINTADNSEVFGTANTGGYVVFARILGDGIKVADAIAALTTWNLGSSFTDTPLRNYKSGNLDLKHFVYVKTFRAVPASAVPAAIRTPKLSYSIVGNTNPAAVRAKMSAAGGLLLTPTSRGGRSQITVRTQFPSGHHVDHVVTTTKLGPPSTIKPAPAALSAALGTIASMRAEVTAWPLHIKWQRRTTPASPWVDLVEDSEEAPTPYVGVNTQDLQIYLYGETPVDAAASLALSGSQYRYVVSNSAAFSAPIVEGKPTTFTVVPALAFQDKLAKTTTAALGTATVTLTARATAASLPAPTYQWERKAPGSATWEALVNAKAAVPATGDDPEIPAVHSPYSGVTTSTLTIRLNGTTPPSATGISVADTVDLDKSQYRCVITHDRGSGPLGLASTVTTLRVTTLPVGFAAQPPKTFSGVLGGNASVSVTSLPVASSTPVAYQWWRLPAGQNPKIPDNWIPLDNSTGETPTRYTGVTTRTLTVSLAGADDEAKVAALALNDDQYRCVITNALGTATSAGAQLRVLTKQFTYVTQESMPLPGLASGGGALFTATGLPKGLSLAEGTGVLSGIPTAKPGLYKVTVTIRTGGVVTGTRIYYIEVRALSGNVVGQFEALLAPDADSAHAAKLALIVSANGRFTGTLVTAKDKTTLPLKGVLVRDASTGTLSLAVPLAVTRSGQPAGHVYLLSAADITTSGVFSATLNRRDGTEASAVPEGTATAGVRLATYSNSNPAPWAYMGVYHLALAKPALLSEDEDAAPIPAGSGYARAPISATGLLKIAGMLPDGAPFTASVPTGTDASYRVFARPYKAVAGAFLSSDFKLASTSSYNPSTGGYFNRYALAAGSGEDSYWTRPADIVSPAGYAEGFGPLGLSLKVQPWLFFNGTNLGLTFTGPQGSEVATIGLVVDGGVLSAAGLPATLKLDLAKLTFADSTPPDASQFSLKLNQATGKLTGSLRLADGRVVSLEGLFLVPTNANNATLANGTVTVEGFATIPPLAGSDAGPTTERFRLHKEGAVPTP